MFAICFVKYKSYDLTFHSHAGDHTAKLAVRPYGIQNQHLVTGGNFFKILHL